MAKRSRLLFVGVTPKGRVIWETIQETWASAVRETEWDAVGMGRSWAEAKQLGYRVVRARIVLEESDG